MLQWKYFITMQLSTNESAVMRELDQSILLVPWVSQLVVDEELEGGVVQVGGETQPGQGEQEQGGEDLHHYPVLGFISEIFSVIIILLEMLSGAKIFSCFEIFSAVNWISSARLEPVSHWLRGVRSVIIIISLCLLSPWSYTIHERRGEALENMIRI